MVCAVCFRRQAESEWRQHKLREGRMPRDLDAKLRVVIDKQEIHEVIMRYCRGIDRGDVDLVLSTFHEDAVDNHVGIEERVVVQVPKALELAKTAVIWTSHNITNQLVDVAGGAA